MHKAGMAAAAGIYALRHHVDRLADDHTRAKKLADAITTIPGIELDQDQIDTNIVYFDVAGSGIDAAEFVSRTAAHGVRFKLTARTRVRAVTHLDIRDDHVEPIANAVRAACGTTAYA